jgi:hypothetical protein
MQKVEGSSPFIRSSQRPRYRGASLFPGAGRGASTATRLRPLLMVAMRAPVP